MLLDYLKKPHACNNSLAIQWQERKVFQRTTIKESLGEHWLFRVLDKNVPTFAVFFMITVCWYPECGL